MSPTPSRRPSFTPRTVEISSKETRLARGRQGRLADATGRVEDQIEAGDPLPTVAAARKANAFARVSVTEPFWTCSTIPHFAHAGVHRPNRAPSQLADKGVLGMKRRCTGSPTA